MQPTPPPLHKPPPKALLLGAHAEERVRLRPALESARFVVADAADMVEAGLRIRELTLWAPSGVPPVVIICAAEASEVKGVVADIGMRYAPRPPILVVLDAPWLEQHSPIPGADEMLSAQPHPEVVAERAAALARLAQAEAQLRALERYVPAPLYHSIVNTGTAGGAELRELTILFSDIRGFTDATDFSGLDDTLEVLNDYFRSASDVVSSHGGVIDKFTGDGILAYFAAVPGSANGSVLAVRAAMQLQLILEQRRAAWFERGILPVGLGIGLTTGPVVVGTIGGSRRADYTVIGSHVNLAARLQAHSRGDIVICAETAARVRHAVQLDAGNEVNVKGFDRAIQVFRVMGNLAAAPL